jgi:spore coat polysaccharide biosynthesis predicted glycosyltransferase SpsG
VNPPPPLFFRCAGSAELGLGHVMRAIALAEVARRRRGHVTFVMPTDGLASAIPSRYGFAVEPVAADLGPEREAALIEARAPADAWVVVDGYALGDRVRPLRRRGLRVCLVDDAPGGMSAGAEADLWISPGFGAAARARNALAGPRYAPLRAELRQTRLAAVAESGTPRRVRLVVLTGGGDVGGLLGRVIEALGQAAALPPMEVLAVLGPAAPEPDAAAVASLATRMPIELVRAPSDLAARLSRSDLAITAAGTTVLELLCLGVPPLMVTVVANQMGVASRIANLGAGIDLGVPAELRPAELARAILQVLASRAQFVRVGRALVDGGGARRVIAVIARAAKRASA